MLDPAQPSLDGAALVEAAEQRFGVTLTLLISVDELLRASASWSNQPVDETLAELVQRMGERLIEIEAAAEAIREWQELIEHLTGG